MRLAEQWDEIRGGLPDNWTAVRLALTVSDEEQADRAALVLAPLAPGRTGWAFRLVASRRRDPRRMLWRLDEEGVRGRLDLVEAERPGETSPVPARTTTLATQWDELIGRLPPDWSDLYAQIELESSDFLERGALLLAPVNPARRGGRASFRFRCARTAGYGVAAAMARRCLERLDAERITGSVRALRVLSNTRHAATQGPVWYVGGKPV
jgi:hypothetical protein